MRKTCMRIVEQPIGATNRTKIPRNQAAKPSHEHKTTGILCTGTCVSPFTHVLRKSSTCVRPASLQLYGALRGYYIIDYIISYYIILYDMVIEDPG